MGTPLGLPVVPSGENLSQTLDHLRRAHTCHGGAGLLSRFHPDGLNLPQGAYNP